MINRVYINCDRYIATMMMMMMTILMFKEMSIMISRDIKKHKYNGFEKKFKIIGEKFDNSDFINNDEDLKFELNVNIGLLKRNS